MKRKMETGEAIDLSQRPRTPEGWILLDEPLKIGQDYCLADSEQWVFWCFRLKDGRIVAGTSTVKMPRPPQAEKLLWLR